MKKLLLCAALLSASGYLSAQAFDPLNNVWIRLDGGAGGGSFGGTVTSVDCTSSEATIATCLGGPITTSGTFTISWQTQAANAVLIGPTNGAAAAPSFRVPGSLDFTAWGVLPQALADAKGDMIAASAADTWAKVTVGSNDTLLVADSAQSTGVKWVAGGTWLTQANKIAFGIPFRVACTIPDADITSDATETIYAACQVPANALGTAGTLHIMGGGDILMNTADTGQIKVKVGCTNGTDSTGCTTIYDSGTDVFLGSANAARYALHWDAVIQESGSNQQYASGSVRAGNRQAATTGTSDFDSAITAPQKAWSSSSTGTTVSTSSAWYVQLTHKWSASSSSLSWRTWYVTMIVYP